MYIFSSIAHVKCAFMAEIENALTCSTVCVSAISLTCMAPVRTNISRPGDP